MLQVLRPALFGFVVFVVFAGSLPAQESLPKATIDGTGPGWKELTLDDFQMVNGDDDTWTWKDGVIHCTGQARRRDAEQEAGDQLRAGGPVAAPQSRRQLGHLRVGSRGGPEGPAERAAPAGRHRGAGARPRLHGALRERVRKEGRLVHHQRRRVPGRQVEDEAVPARLARRQRQLSDARS